MELPSKYPPEHYDQKAQRYAWTLRHLWRVEVDDATTARWSQAIAFARSIDTYLDENDRAELGERTKEIYDFFSMPEEVGKRYPALSIEQLGVEGYERCRDVGSLILDLNLHIKSVTSISEYGKLRRAEGRAYAQFIANLATSKVALQPGYKEFTAQLQRIGEATNVLNSIRNIRGDYKRGELVLKPSWNVYPRLLGHFCMSLTTSHD